MGVPLLRVLSMKAWNDRLNVVVKDGYRVLTRDVIKHAATSALLDAALLRLRDMPLVTLTSEASHIKVKSIADGKAKGEGAYGDASAPHYPAELGLSAKPLFDAIKCPAHDVAQFSGEETEVLAAAVCPVKLRVFFRVTGDVAPLDVSNIMRIADNDDDAA